MNQNRIIELEIKIAYQEDLLQSLNCAVSDQQMQIKRLEQTFVLLNEKLKNLAESPTVNQAVEIPPHY